MGHQSTDKLTEIHYKHTRTRNVRGVIKPIPSIPSRSVYRNHKTYIYTHECFSLKYPQTPNFIIFSCNKQNIFQTCVFMSNT